MMTALADGFEPMTVESLEEVSVGVAWTDYADYMYLARVREAARLFPRREDIENDLPLAEHIGPVFMREVADVHRDLFAEFADSYGENVRTKIERCLAVRDAEYENALEMRKDLRFDAEAVMNRFDLVLTPTLAFVAPRLPVDELEIREEVIRFTLPFNALGWPTLAMPCGPAEDGLPASLQIIGKPGSDALVLAVGELVESLIRGNSI
jgi:Asp-tRNA(Asn)/Glu-tRNA(Gln) amidotransferase A subunit family amidase